MITDVGMSKVERRVAVLRDLDVLNGGDFPGLDHLTALAADVCDANLGAFVVNDGAQAYQLSTTFGTRETMPGLECMCTPILEAGATLISDDARHDRRFAGARYVHSAPHVRSFVGVPVGAVPELPLGVLAVGHTEAGMFGPRQAQRLERIAELVTSFLVARLEGIEALRAAAKTDEERKRQHLFELIFNAIQEGVNVVAPRRGLVEVNPACLELMGITREEAALG